jgi:hypothetical protein
VQKPKIKIEKTWGPDEIAIFSTGQLQSAGMDKEAQQLMGKLAKIRTDLVDSWSTPDDKMPTTIEGLEDMGMKMVSSIREERKQYIEIVGQYMEVEEE